MEENELETIKDLQSAEVCSTNCKLCIPYVEKMLKTGETSFPLDFILNSTR